MRTFLTVVLIIIALDTIGLITLLIARRVPEGRLDRIISHPERGWYAFVVVVLILMGAILWAFVFPLMDELSGRP